MKNSYVSREETSKVKKTWIENLIKRNKLSYLLISFSQGISHIAELALQYFYKDYLLLQPYEVSRISAIIMIPFILKPILGLMTDMVPICGYRRKIYLMICGLVSCFCWLYLSFMATSLYPVVVALLTNNFSFSFASIIGEAIVVELSNITGEGGREGKDLNETAHDKAKENVSLFFFVKNSGVLISAFLRGYLVQLMTLRHVFLVKSFIPLLLFIAGIILVESRIGCDKYGRDSEETYNVVEVYDNLSVDPTLRETLLLRGRVRKLSLVSEVDKNKLITDFIKFISQRDVLIPAFIAIILFAPPSISDPMFYFNTNVLLFTPSQLGFLSFMSSLGVLSAIISYRLYLKIWSFHKLIISTSLMYSVCLCLILGLVVRINIIWGIPDFFLCCTSFFFLSIMGELSMMPILTLACQICPKKLEASVYSFFMSATNVGLTISSLSSSIITAYLGITAKDFSQLRNLILITSLFNLLPLILIIYLHPKYFEAKYKEDQLLEIELDEAIDQAENVAKIKL